MGAKERVVNIKNRPICIASIFFVLGILIGMNIQISILYIISIFLIILIIILIIFQKQINYKIFAFFFIFIFGFVYSSALQQRNYEIYNNIKGKQIIEAIIISEPEDKEYKYRYTIKVKKINNKSGTEGIKLFLDIKKKDIKYLPTYGEKICIYGNVDIPEQSRNYKGFDYKRYLITKKIFGIIESEEIKKTNKESINFFSKMINNVQNSINKNLKSILNEQEANLCIGILIGDRTEISEEIEENFKNSNLTHMLAVSGSHITYIINSLAILLGKTNKKISKIITILFLIFFMILTGFTASVLRASFMGIIVLISSLLFRKSDTINNLSISSFLILLINPFTIWDIGFILSYFGTLGIVLFSNKIIKYIEKIKSNLNKLNNNIAKIILRVINKKIFIYLFSTLVITVSANILIIPIMAYSFSTISYTFWISNVLAGPIMEIVTILGFIVYIISIVFYPLAQILGFLLNFLLSLLIKIAEISSIIPGATNYIKTPSIISCFLYFAFIIIILKRRIVIIYAKKLLRRVKKSRSLRKSIIILTTIVIIINIFIIDHNKLKIFFIDVGQGDSTLIQTTKNKNILIDGGGSEFGDYDVGKNILLPYLLDRKVNTIDYMIISHFDSDHVKGLFIILKELKVKNVIISKQGKDSANFQEFLKIIANKKLNIIVVKKGDYIKIDEDTYIEILYPDEDLIQDNILNNNSIVCKVESNGLKMLFTGDIEQVAENSIYNIYKDTNRLKADILKVSHHGSKTSSTEDFLKLVQPKIALIGVGKNNKFGHPNEVVIDRLKGCTSNIYRTDYTGEVIIEYVGKKLKISTHINNE